MPNSLNLRFTASSPEDSEFPQPPGAALMRMLIADLKRSDWHIGEMSNWRDCGWSITCRRSTAEVEVMLASGEQQVWMLQVAPLRVPGFLGRLFGGTISATPDDVHSLAVSIHAATTSFSAFSSPLWCWDDFPDETTATSEPVGPTKPLEPTG